jgi:hypothetical protein
MQKIVQRMRKELALPAYFTLHACRHGELTELEEAELTDGQGRALSAIARRDPTKDMPRGTYRARCRLLGNGMPMCWRTHQKQSVRMTPWWTVRIKIRTIQEAPDFIG